MKQSVRQPARLLLHTGDVFFCNYIAMLLLASLFGFELSGGLTGAILAASFLSMAVLSLRNHRRTAVLCYFGVLVVSGAILRGRLWYGAQWIWYEFLVLIGRRFGITWDIPANFDYPFERDVFLGFVAALFCLLLAVSYRFKRSALTWTILTAMSLYIALILNVFPEPKAMILYACMLFYLRISLTLSRMESRKLFLYEPLLLSLIAITVFLTTLVITPERHQDSIESGRVRQWVRAFNEKTVNRIADRINAKWNKDGKASAGVSGGWVSDDSLVYSGETHLVVTLPKNSPRTYLRAYAGGDYESGRWHESTGTGNVSLTLPGGSRRSESVSHIHYIGYEMLNFLFASYDYPNLEDMAGLSGMPYMPQNLPEYVEYRMQTAPHTFLRIPEATRFPLYRAGMSIVVKNANNRFVYTPYCLAPDMADSYSLYMNWDGAWGNYDTGKDYYEFYYIYNTRGLPNYYAFSDGATLKQEEIPLFVNISEQEREYEKAYLTAYDWEVRTGVYAEVPNRFKEALSEMLPGSAYSLQNTEAIITFVQNFMKNHFRYTLTPPKNDSGKDPVLFFIEDSQQGYCQHYASAAVFLFRMLGVPARYAEGYVISTSDIDTGSKAAAVNRMTYGYGMEENWTDARWDGGVAEDYEDSYVSVKVTDRGAHAWVEIWLPNYGWYPVEVTYGFEDAASLNIENEKPPEPKNTPTPRPGISGTPTPTVRPTGNPAAPTQKPGTKKKAGEIKEPFFSRPVGIAVIVLGILLLFAVILFGRYYIIVLNRNRRFFTKNPNRATVALYKEIIRLAGFLGIRRMPGEMDREFHERLFNELPHYSEDISMENTAKITERAVFSKDGVTGPEKILVKRYYRKLRKELLSKKKPFERFFFLLINGI